MAFLCPVRRKNKKMRSGWRELDAPLPGRLTGSASIDTLVRVGLEKERGGPRARMLVLSDFVPCVEDELAVKRGDHVQVLYQENDWLYVIAEDGREGFVPYTYCLPAKRSVDDSALPKKPNNLETAAASQSSQHNQRLNNNGVSAMGLGKTILTTLNSGDGSPQYKQLSRSLPDIAAGLSTDSRQGSVRSTTCEQQPLLSQGDTLSIRSQISHANTDKTSVKSLVHSVDGSSVRTNLNRTSQIVDSSISSELDRRSLYSQTSQKTTSLRSTSRSPDSGIRGRREERVTKDAGYSRDSQRSSSYSNNEAGYRRRSASSHGERRTSHPASESLYNVAGHKALPDSSSIRSGRGESRNKSRNNHRSASVGSRNRYSTNNNQETDKIAKDYNTLLQRHDQNQQLDAAQSTHPHYHVNETGHRLHEIQQSSSKRYQDTRLHCDREKESNAHKNNPHTNSHGHKVGLLQLHYQNQQDNEQQSQQSTQQPSQQQKHRPLQQQHVGLHQQNQQIIQQHNVQQQKQTQAQQQNQVFRKQFQGRYIVLFKFSGQEENDLNVERGEFVSVLNTDDPRWYWVQRSDYQEGFVPSSFLCAAQPQENCNETNRMNNEAPVLPPGGARSSNRRNTHTSPERALRINTGQATKLVCLYDFQARAPDDLSVRRGQWLFADLAGQPDHDWLWVYSPVAHTAGYIPRSYAKPPNFGMDFNQYENMRLRDTSVAH